MLCFVNKNDFLKKKYSQSIYILTSEVLYICR